VKIFVTGGSGFLGSHVCDALSDAGHEVTIFDVKPSPYLRKDQKMMTGDILDLHLLEGALEGMDVVYHFAGIADIDECVEKPVDTARINVLGTVTLLDAAARAGIKRFVLASSVYVFSSSGYFYRSSKRACEDFMDDYAQRYGLKYTCLRYGSLYGPRADKRNSIFRLLKEAMETGRMTYKGCGDEQREYIHVLDAARSSVKILDSKFENQNVILTGMERFRYIELLEMIKEIFGGSVEINIEPTDRKAHYKLTPYSYTPPLGLKLVNNPYVDFGQGILECLGDIEKQGHGEG
jgi:UDP-glucose 4-epimerase